MGGVLSILILGVGAVGGGSASLSQEWGQCGGGALCGSPHVCSRNGDPKTPPFKGMVVLPAPNAAHAGSSAGTVLCHPWMGDPKPLFFGWWWFSPPAWLPLLGSSARAAPVRSWMGDQLFPLGDPFLGGHSPLIFGVSPFPLGKGP